MKEGENMANSLNTVTVDGVTQSLESYNNSQKNVISGTKQSLDKNAFLKLMVTQLKYQDPLDPQDNSEYVAELAQFSSLEQMTNVAEGLTDVSKIVSNIDTSVLVGQLSSMIDKEIQWASTTKYTDEEGNVQSSTVQMEGKVTGVSISDGVPMVVATSNGKNYQVSVSDILLVRQQNESTL